MVAVRVLWCSLLLLSLALAGCSGGKDKDDGHDDHDDGTDAAAGLGNATGLVAKIEVYVNGTLATPANGSISVDLDVPVTFDASNSTGAILEYQWDFGDNATSSDRREDHSFNATGNYTVRLVVANGNLTANATVTLTVAGVPAAQALFTQHEDFEGTVPLANPNSPFQAGVDYVDHAVTIAAADANGTAAAAVTARIHVESSPFSVFVYWIGPDGTTLATAGAAPDTSAEQDILYEAAMPPGEYIVRVRVFAGAATSYSGTADIDYVTA